MTTAPSVELRFNPTDLRPRDLPQAGAFLGSPADALEAALAISRAQMVDRMRAELRGLSEPTQAQMLRIADLAWQAVFWRFRKVSAPVMADAYIRAYRAANAGDVPMSVVYDLADKHAEKVGDYFHMSSRQALAEGFTGLVNRQLPRKAAADRVLDAYGLTPRQMRAYTGAKQFSTPVTDVLPRSLKAKARAYIDKAFTTRIRKFSKQEEHNIGQQAQQFAWMWLQDKGRLSTKAQKMWITAKDERVCEVCGPLHGKKVGVNERFTTSHGEFWTPGLHPNCRCVVRLLENRFAKALAGAELHEFNRLHPRANDGRFGAKARTRTVNVDEEFRRITAGQRAPDEQLRAQFEDVVRGSIHRQALAQPQTRPRQVSVVSDRPRPQVQATRPTVASTRPRAVSTRPTATSVRAQVQLQQEIAARVKAEPQPKVAPDTGVRVIREGTKAPTQPIVSSFAILPAAAFEQEGMQYVRTEYGMTFVPNQKQAEKLAGDMIQQAIDDEVERLSQGKGATLHAVEAGVGVAKFDISKEELRKIVEWHAAQARIDNLMSNPAIGYEHQINPLEEEAYVSSTWKDESGKPIGPKRPLSYRYIGGRLGIEKDKFDLRVVEVDEALMDQVDVEPGETHLQGEFETIPESIAVSEEGVVPVLRMKIQPIRTPEETVNRMKLLQEKLKNLEQHKKPD